MPLVTGNIWESYRTNEFVMVIDGQPSPGISKISGLSKARWTRWSSLTAARTTCTRSPRPR